MEAGSSLGEHRRELAEYFEEDACQTHLATLCICAMPAPQHGDVIYNKINDKTYILLLITPPVLQTSWPKKGAGIHLPPRPCQLQMRAVVLTARLARLFIASMPRSIHIQIHKIVFVQEQTITFGHSPVWPG